MKRQYNPKTSEEQQQQQQREKDDSAASPSSQSPSNSTQSSPESASQPSNYAILYVDVVKNMTKLVISQPPPPPPCPAPEFSIFREDFPALPGTRLSSTSSSMVPDDWTAMLSDDEADEASAGCLEELAASGPASSASTEEEEQNLAPIVQSAAATPATQSSMAAGAFNCEFLPQLFGYLNNPARFSVSLIFGKQFLHEGVRQRAQLKSLGRQIPSASRLQAPPGFENTPLYAHLNTTPNGSPFGGVYFDSGSTGLEELCQTDGSFVDGCFGMLGLARNLGLVQHNPQFKEQFLGEESERDTEFNCKHQPKTNIIPEKGIPARVPKNYVIAGKIDLQQPKMEQMEVELLFYFFYTFTGDMMQLLAAAELAERGWRFHKLDHLWILRQPDNPNYIYRGFQESGEYNYFNMYKWRILPRYFQLEPDHLERTVSKDELYEEYGYHPQMAR
ncbi:hypothetical protein KR038_011240 [Drosophila bunnanda]|nr:hypothetical protein KR038_011240 [Drosophila bunnanda]